MTTKEVETLHIPILCTHRKKICRASYALHLKTPGEAKWGLGKYKISRVKISHVVTLTVDIVVTCSYNCSYMGEIKIFSNNEIPPEFWLLAGVGIFFFLICWGLSLL